MAKIYERENFTDEDRKRRDRLFFELYGYMPDEGMEGFERERLKRDKRGVFGRREDLRMRYQQSGLLD